MNSLLTTLEHNRIERAIAAAEQRTSGEFRVVVHPDRVDDALALAAAEFSRLQMHRTRERNAILILIAPKSRSFALYGDSGVHAKVGDAFWREVATAMEGHFRRGAFADGLVHAIERAGALLAQHFPRQPDDKNELPDGVVERGIVI